MRTSETRCRGREPVLSADGEVLETADRVSVLPSNRLSVDAAASIKNVFTKSGQVRVEMHDKQSALLALAKHLRLFEEESAPTLTLNQVNMGGMNAIEAAQRVAFLLASVAAGRAELKSLPISADE